MEQPRRFKNNLTLDGIDQDHLGNFITIASPGCKSMELNLVDFLASSSKIGRLWLVSRTSSPPE